LGDGGGSDAGAAVAILMLEVMKIDPTRATTLTSRTELLDFFGTK
jgi:hypothetical protein